VAIVSFQAFVDSSRGGVVERLCNARRAQCIWLNLPLRLAAVGCTVQWTFGAEIKKKNFIVCNNINTKFTSQWRHCRV